jgi:hypothetical protein
VEELGVPQMVRQLIAFCGTRRLITVFTVPATAPALPSYLTNIRFNIIFPLYA